jgi:hypothetical protein
MVTVVVIVVDTDHVDSEAVVAVLIEGSNRKQTAATGKLANQTTRKETRILELRYRDLEGATSQAASAATMSVTAKQ